MTTTLIPNRSLLNEAIVATLRTMPGGFAFDLRRIPDLPPTYFDSDGRMVKPYGIVYPMTGHTTYENFADSECQAEYPFQLRSVGASDEQAQWLAETCRQFLLARAGNGDYAHPLATAVGRPALDVQVLRIYPSEVGGPEPEGSGLSNVNDIYDVEVQSG